MEPVIRSLSGTDFDSIHQTFLRAFSDYAVDTSYMTRDVLYHRCIKNGMDPACSAGAFRGDDLVGFSLTGLDRFCEELSAFDIITGIIPEERARGLAGRMFTTILLEVQQRGAKKFYLEVLQQNGPAIQAYRKAGFRISREFDCLEMELEHFHPPQGVPGLEIRPCRIADILDHSHFSEPEPSWENSFGSLGRIIDPVRCYLAEYHGKPAGIMAYYPSTNWIMVLATDPAHRRKGIASAMLSNLVENLAHDHKKLRIINVELQNRPALAFCRRNGFLSFTKQYEMVLDLNDLNPSITR